MADFAERLSELMIEKSVSAQELADAIGVVKSTVHDWKRGKFHVSLSKALQLANFFGCSLDFLMGRSETVLDYIPNDCPPFYPHLITVLEKCGVKAYSLRTNTSIKGAHFDNWKNGAEPIIPTLLVVADYLKVSIDYLVGRDR